jgi:hypothetical protein
MLEINELSASKIQSLLGFEENFFHKSKRKKDWLSKKEIKEFSK